MRKALAIGFVLMVLFLPLAQAVTDQGADGITVYEISSEDPPLFGELAIVLPKALYNAGELVQATVGSGVPCNTKYVYLTIEKQDGTQLYYKDISSLFYPCSTSYAKVSFSAPSTTGTYYVKVAFKDSTGKVLYTDSTIFNVGTQTCPSGYCTEWTSVQKYEYGTKQQKTCYTYSQTNACAQTQSQFYRTVCDTGFELVNGNCVKPNNVATCGDRVVQTGEQCDRGDENGVCPATCNAMCQTSNCQALPNEEPPADNDDEDNCTNGFKLSISDEEKCITKAQLTGGIIIGMLVMAGVLTIIGLVMMKRR